MPPAGLGGSLGMEEEGGCCCCCAGGAVVPPLPDVVPPEGVLDWLPPRAGKLGMRGGRLGRPPAGLDGWAGEGVGAADVGNVLALCLLYILSSCVEECK